MPHNRECTKVKFSSQKDADFYIDKLNKTSDGRKKPLRSYLCVYCNAWHLTSRDSHENQVITKLKEEIAYLKKQITELKSSANKDVVAQVKKDDRVKVLTARIKEKERVNKNIRKDNADLIAKIIKLENELKDAKNKTA